MQVQINPEIREANGKPYAFIPLSGCLDEETLPGFSEAVESLLEKPHAYLVFDLGELDLISSHAVGYFETMYRKSEALQKKIAFVNINEEIYEILELIGLVQLITVFEAEDKFLEAVANGEI